MLSNVISWKRLTQRFFHACHCIALTRMISQVGMPFRTTRRINFLGLLKEVCVCKLEDMKIRPFKLERFFSQYEFEVPYLLCASDCESLRIEELMAFEPAALQSFAGLSLGYSESAGHPALREQIAGLYSNVGEQQILVHQGAQEVILNLMNVLLEKGDHIVVHFPCYQSLYEVAKSIGCEVTQWVADEKRDWELDLNFLEDSVRSNTKAIIINCPHNPTGYLMDREKFQSVLEIAQKRNVCLISDEVYRFLEYDSSDRLPPACDLYERAVSIGVMSKSFGLAGLRIGWAATQDANLLKQMAIFKDYTTICNSAPSEFLATLALKHKSEVLDRNLKIIENNLSILDKFFQDHEQLFDWYRPKAGPIAFPAWKGGGDSDHFSAKLLKRTGVLLLPGSQFEIAGNNFRIGFGRKNLPEAIEKFRGFIDEIASA